ncbi:MAG: 3-isopropylmalate dehydratase [Spirochaetota bacterium]|nr:3-isopropylmalate dehydratase [Spirochaetota bacterium]
MSDKISGKIFVVKDDIDTDQIIPAQYLNLLPTVPEERRKLGSYALIGLPDSYPQFIKEGKDESEYSIIIAGKNFGCGSSREHAPIALSAAGVILVIAESYSRIFFRNSVNAGLLFPYETPKRICDEMITGNNIEFNLDTKILINKTTGKSYNINPLGDAEIIIQCGGIFEYAKKYGTQ